MNSRAGVGIGKMNMVVSQFRTERFKSLEGNEGNMNVDGIISTFNNEGSSNNNKGLEVSNNELGKDGEKNPLNSLTTNSSKDVGNIVDSSNDNVTKIDLQSIEEDSGLNILHEDNTSNNNYSTQNHKNSISINRSDDSPIINSFAINKATTDPSMIGQLADSNVDSEVSSISNNKEKNPLKYINEIED